MAVERRRVELREGVDLGDVGVDAVGYGDVDQAVVGAQGHGGLGAVLGQGVEARAGAAAQDDAQDGLAVVGLRAGVVVSGRWRGPTQAVLLPLLPLESLLIIQKSALFAILCV